MLLTELNVDDLNKLEQFRIKRLQLFFTSSLPYCLLRVEVDSTFTIYCLHSKTVDELLDNLEDLCSYAWLILGVKRIALYFGLEEILCTDIKCSQSVNNNQNS